MGFEHLLSADELKMLEESSEYLTICSDGGAEEKHKVSGVSSQNSQIVVRSLTPNYDITLDPMNVSRPNVVAPVQEIGNKFEDLTVRDIEKEFDSIIKASDKVQVEFKRFRKAKKKVYSHK